MSDFQVLVFSLTGYKLVTLLTGLVFGLLGYKLFRLGVYEKAGELKTTWGDKSLILKQAAPGTFFALFGVILISTTLIKGFDVERMKSVVIPVVTPTVTSDANATRTIFDERSSEESAAIEKFISGENLNEKEKLVLQRYLFKQVISQERVHGMIPTTR